MAIEYLDIYNTITHYTDEELYVLKKELIEKHFDDIIKSAKLRKQCLNKFGFAIPTEQTLYEILDLNRPIVEIGAGTGYWTYLLRERGADVVAIDNNSFEFLKKNYLDTYYKWRSYPSF